jgi:rubrerythrin
MRAAWENDNRLLVQARQERNEALTELAEARAVIKTLANAIVHVTHCDLCDEKGEWHPECIACLIGEGACTCATEPTEVCPSCGGTKNIFHEDPTMAQALATIKPPTGFPPRMELLPFLAP